MNRRKFLSVSAGAVSGLLLKGCSSNLLSSKADPEPFKISLAQWSLHKRLEGTEEPYLDNLDFAKVARGYGLDAVEYVNRFFLDKGKDQKYLAEMKKRADDNGVKCVNIMCDKEGNVGDPDKVKRDQCVENHKKWIDAARFFGCDTIRVNAYSKGTPEEQQKLVADGWSRLCEYAAKVDVNVIVENHGGLSSDPDWLIGIVKMIDMPNAGVLPDFGNFPKEIDRYEAVAKMMPYAKRVSAKSYDFDANGNETLIDYSRMMKVVLDAGYDYYVGIEFETHGLNEDKGVKATKRLLEKIRSSYKKA